jgi:hypothetical protein
MHKSRSSGLGLGACGQQIFAVGNFYKRLRIWQILSKVLRLKFLSEMLKEHAQRRWLTAMLQVRKAAGSSPDEVIDSFNLPNPFSRTMTLGVTQPLIEMSKRSF